MNRREERVMDKKLYMDADIDMAAISGAQVVVIGYGTQGTARALNMRDSGLDVFIGADEGHPDWERAEKDGFEVVTIEAAAKRADVFEIQIPDMAYRCAAAYNDRIRQAAKADHMVCLSSAFNYYYGHMELSPGVDAVVTAAKSPGSAVRTEFVAGGGVPALLAVHQDGSGRAWEKGLALCGAMGFGRVGIQKSTVEEETVTDLLGEHCAWGCIVVLLQTVFEVMVEAGYDADVAFYEAVNESKLTTDLIYKFGMGGMLERISNTAAYGAMTIGPKIIDESVKERIRWAMENIKNGGFDKAWRRDYEAGYPDYQKRLREISEHPADVVGNRIRQQLGVLKESDFSIKNPLK
jgi:ketol-acid reductoisomerase